MIKFILTFLVSFQSYALAKPASSEMLFKIVNGDLTSQFSIKKNKNDAEVEFTNSLGRREIRKIKLNDYKFLMKETGGYKGQNSKEFCYRHYIEFNDQKNKHLACIGSSTRISAQMKQTTALLSLLF